MTSPGGEANHRGGDDHPAAIVGQEHEAEIGGALQDVGDAIRQAGAAVVVAEQALDHQRQPEGQQQAVEMVQMIQPADHSPLQDHAERADDQRRQDQRREIADAGVLQQHPGGEGAHHEQRAMREVDDVQHAEDHREPQRQHRVERAVDQPEQELAEQQRARDAEDHDHRVSPPRSGRGHRIVARSVSRLADELAVALAQRPIRLGRPASLPPA